MLNLRAALRPLAAVLAAVVLTGASPPRGAPGAAIDAFLDDWLHRHPERATLLGDHRFDRRLPDFSAAAPGEDEAARRRAIEEWPAGSAERLLLEGLPAGSPGFEQLPGRIRLALLGPMRGSYASPCSRALAMTARLRQLPEAFREITRLAGAAGWPRQRTMAALDEVEWLLALCRTDMAAGFDACRETRAIAPLAEADSQAVRSLEAFRELARQALEHAPAVEPAPASGDLSAALLHLTGSPDRAPSLPGMLARVRAALDSLGPAEPTAIGPDSLVTREAIAARLSAVRQTIVRENRFPLAPRDRVAASARPTPDGPAPPAPLVHRGVLDPGGPPARLDLGGWPRGGSGALADDPRRGAASLELCLVREGLPGRAAWAAAESRQRSRVRRAFGLEAVREAWAREIERSWVARAAIPERDALEREHRALERERLARAAVELMLRIERTSPEDAATWLARTARLDDAEAARAVRRAWIAPEFAPTTWALWELQALRDRQAQAIGARFELRAFHDAVLRAGAIPLSAQAAEVGAALAAPEAR